MDRRYVKLHGLCVLTTMSDFKIQGLPARECKRYMSFVSMLGRTKVASFLFLTTTQLMRLKALPYSLPKNIALVE